MTFLRVSLKLLPFVGLLLLILTSDNNAMQECFLGPVPKF